jgi:hypothetical protein
MSLSKQSTFAGLRVRRLLIGLLWLSGVVIGLALVTNHDFAEGAAGPSPLDWPSRSLLPHSDHDYTLVMFAHPRCPCTRASLEELTKLLARNQNSVSKWVVFYRPSGADDSWEQTDQCQTAGKIPGVHIASDMDGAEAKLFHAQTSGHTLLYGPTGKLLFSGGITVARGHAGDNDGRSAIEAILSKSLPTTRETPVYGCPIIPPTAGK